ncbi:hypothetical protein [Terriglobus albidus]|uniref:hypothetical protein n=1 Tax=Terriglobus albidus TaxID=1592106 RepID=UPI0021DFA7DD|nr:hypothetical protein [Terriglobus albidus]
MSSRIFPALLLVSAVSVAQQTAPNSVGSQGTSTQVQQGTQTQVQGAQRGNNTTAQAVQATNLDAELKSSLDSKKAKQGDQVTAVTKSAAVLNNGTTLPKGTTLIGHVTEAAAYNKQAGTGSVTFLFDQAKTKEGNTIPIYAVVRDLKPSLMSQYQMSQTGGGNADPGMAAPAPAPDPSGGGGVAPSAGGVVGNTVGGVRGATTNTVNRAGQTVGGATNTVGSAANGAGETVGSTAGQVSGAGTVGANGAVQTAIPGVMLSASTDTSNSGTVAASGQNVHVDSGSQMTLAVAARQ